MSVIADALRKVDPVVDVRQLPPHWHISSCSNLDASRLLWFAAPVVLTLLASLCLWLLLLQPRLIENRDVVVAADQRQDNAIGAGQLSPERSRAEVDGNQVLAVGDREAKLGKPSETILVKGAHAEDLEMSLRPYSLEKKTLARGSTSKQPAKKDEVTQQESTKLSMPKLAATDSAAVKLTAATGNQQANAEIVLQGEKQPFKAKEKANLQSEKQPLKTPVVAAQGASATVSAASASWLEQSKQLEQSGNIKGAIAVLERHTGEPGFWGIGDPYLARLLYRDRQYAKALYWYREQLIMNPNNVKALVGLGVCHEALGNVGSATAVYRRIVQKQGMKSPLGEFSIGRLAKLRGA